MATAMPSSSIACRPMPISPTPWPRTSRISATAKSRVRFEGISGRIDQGAGILFNLKPNGDYLTIRANPLENNLVLWKFEKGKRSSVKWIRNTPTADAPVARPQGADRRDQGRRLSRRQALPGARPAAAGLGTHRPVVQGRQPCVFRRLHRDAGRLIDGAVAGLAVVARACSRAWAPADGRTSSTSTRHARRAGSATASPPSSCRPICWSSGSIRSRSASLQPLRFSARPRRPWRSGIWRRATTCARCFWSARS